MNAFRETDKVETIGQILETKSQTSAQPSKCDCGVPIKSVTCGRFTMTPSLCQVCNAEQQRLNDERLAAETAAREQARFAAVIPRLYRDARIEHLSPALQEKILGLDDGRGLFLWGNVGVGKTYAMAAIARHFIEARRYVKRVVWGRLLYDIRETFHKQDRDESTITRPLLKAQKVIIEDIGTGVGLDKQESDFAIRTLNMVLDSRIEACLPVFVTSNLSIESLGRSFDERIASRIQGCCDVIQLQGNDRRAKDTKSREV